MPDPILEQYKEAAAGRPRGRPEGPARGRARPLPARRRAGRGPRHAADEHGPGAAPHGPHGRGAGGLLQGARPGPARRGRPHRADRGPHRRRPGSRGGRDARAAGRGAGRQRPRTGGPRLARAGPEPDRHPPAREAGGRAGDAPRRGPGTAPAAPAEATVRGGATRRRRRPRARRAGREPRRDGPGTARRARAHSTDRRSRPSAPRPAPTPGGPPDLLAAPDPEAFFDEAEQAREAGQTREALALYVLASDAYARAGAREAALEVCQRALAISPDAPSVHLALVRLYLGRGWRERAVEKLTLLDHLLALGPASGARRQIAALAAAHANGDPRMLALASSGVGPPPAQHRPTARSQRPPPDQPVGGKATATIDRTMIEQLRGLLSSLEIQPITIVDVGLTALLIYGAFSLIRGTRAVRLVIGVMRPVRRLRGGPVLRAAAPLPGPPGGRLRRPVRRSSSSSSPSCAGRSSGSGASVRWAGSSARTPGGAVERVAADRRPRGARPWPPSATARSSSSSARPASSDTAEIGRHAPRRPLGRTSSTTLFMPRSALHDGAVIVRGDRIVAAGVILPLAELALALRAPRHAPPGGRWASPSRPTPWPSSSARRRAPSPRRARPVRPPPGRGAPARRPGRAAPAGRRPRASTALEPAGHASRRPSRATAPAPPGHRTRPGSATAGPRPPAPGAGRRSPPAASGAERR